MTYLVETWSSNHERIWVSICSCTHTLSVLLRSFSLLIDCIFGQLVCRLLGFYRGVRENMLYRLSLTRVTVESAASLLRGLIDWIDLDYMYICRTNELPTCELKISQCTLLKTLQAIRSALLFMKSVWHICPGASSIYQTQPVMMYLVETWSSNHERIWVGVCSFTHTWSVLLRTFSLLIDCIFYQLVCRLLGFSHGVRRGYAVPIISNEGEGLVCSFPVAWMNWLDLLRVHVYMQNEWASNI